MNAFPTPATIPAATLLLYVQQRCAQLHKLASSFLAKGLLDPRGADALRHAACIGALGDQAAHLHEVSGLARMAGLYADADRIDAIVDSTCRCCSDMAHDLRMASAGLPHLMHSTSTPPNPPTTPRPGAATPAEQLP